MNRMPALNDESVVTLTGAVTTQPSPVLMNGALPKIESGEVYEVSYTMRVSRASPPPVAHSDDLIASLVAVLILVMPVLVLLGELVKAIKEVFAS